MASQRQSCTESLISWRGFTRTALYRAFNIVTWLHKDNLTTDAVRYTSIGPEILSIALELQCVPSRAVGAVWIYVEVLDAQSPVCDVRWLGCLIVLTLNALFSFGFYTSGVVPTPKTLLEIPLVDVLKFEDYLLIYLWGDVSDNFREMKQKDAYRACAESTNKGVN